MSPHLLISDEFQVKVLGRTLCSSIPHNPEFACLSFPARVRGCPIPFRYESLTLSWVKHSLIVRINRTQKRILVGVTRHGIYRYKVVRADRFSYVGLNSHVQYCVHCARECSTVFICARTRAQKGAKLRLLLLWREGLPRAGIAGA
jgi:hypothetical protein